MSNDNLNEDQRLLALKMIQRAQADLNTDLDHASIEKALDVIQDTQDISSKAVRESILKILRG